MTNGIVKKTRWGKKLVKSKVNTKHKNNMVETPQGNQKVPLKNHCKCDVLSSTPVPSKKIRQPTDWEKVLIVHTAKTGLVHRKYNFHKSITNI
jgi:hypothetical protein